MSISSKPSESIRVVLRCRPLNSTEKNNGNRKIVEMDSRVGLVSVENIEDKDSNVPKQFTYDAVFDWNSTQEGLFMEAALPIVDSVLEGYNGTIFACISFLLLIFFIEIRWADWYW